MVQLSRKKSLQVRLCMRTGRRALRSAQRTGASGVAGGAAIAAVKFLFSFGVLEGVGEPVHAQEGEL